MDEAGKFRIHVVTAVIVTIMVVAFLAYLFASGEFGFYGGHQEPELILDCALPTDRPVMDAPTVVLPTINNETDARTYASAFFPEFSGAEFTSSDLWGTGRNASYESERGDVILSVRGDGEITYGIRDSSWNEVDEEDFPVELARACSVAFIQDHGGLGPYEEVHESASGPVGDNGLEAIAVRSFDYNKRYNGHLIYGYDGIMTSVAFPGPRVHACVLRERQYGPVNASRQVIPAEEAWWAARNVTFAGSGMEIRFTSVELCYYYPVSWESTPVLHPAWRFASSHFDIFVDAFTGIVVG